VPLTVDKEKFITMMVKKHGFNRQQLRTVLEQTNKLDWVIGLMDKQAPQSSSSNVPNGAWIRYKNKFITPDNLPNGVEFWNKYDKDLQRAYKEYGVPPEIIVGIIGVETGWGRVMGKTKVLLALKQVGAELWVKPKLLMHYQRLHFIIQDDHNTLLTNLKTF
jgi:Membrane-bound lytic murein transglycosylase B